MVYLYVHTKKQSPLYLSLLIYFIVILIFPLFIGSIIYNQANSFFIKRSTEAARFSLQSIALTFDRFFEMSDDTIYSFAIDPAMQSASYLTKPAFASKDIIFFTPLINRIKSNDISSLFQNKTVIFLKRPDAVVLQDSIYFGIEQYYNAYMNYENMAYEEWEQTILGTPHNRYFLPSSRVASDGALNPNYTREYITYIHSFPLMTSVILIDSISAKAILSESIISQYGASAILDSMRNIILCAGAEDVVSAIDFSLLEPGAESFIQAIGGAEMIVLCRESGNNGIYYVSVNPVNEAMRDVIYMQRISIIGVFFILIIGSILSLFLSRHYTKPIQEIVAILSKRHTGKNSIKNNFSMIKSQINDLVTSNIELSKIMQNQMIISRSLFFGHLFGGAIRDQQELNHFIEYFSLNLQGNLFAVVYASYLNDANGGGLEISDIFEQDIFKLVIDETLPSIGQYNGYTYLMDNKDVAILLCMQADDVLKARHWIESFIYETRERLIANYKVEPIFGIGTLYEKLLDINFSFSEASIAAEYALRQNSAEPVLWYDSLDTKTKRGYYYPVEIEQNLIRLAKTGKKEEALRNLQQIFKENFSNRSLMRNIQIQLFIEMRSTVARIVNDLKPDINIDSLLHMDFYATPENEVIKCYTQTYISICESVNDNKKSHNQTLIDGILYNIRQNFADPAISVEMLASKFYITPTYFSRFFKEQTGEVFSVHLENLRMAKARQLLDETKLTVDKIAESVGYNSAYSFRRAFKKNYGIVPTEYRN